MDDGKLQEQLNKIFNELSEIKDENQKSNALLKILVKGRVTNKVEAVIATLQKKGILSTPEVRYMFNISRPAALEIMKKVPLVFANARYLDGSTHRQQAARLVLTSEKDETNFKKIMIMLKENNEILPMDSLQKTFGLSLKDARLLAESFCENCPNYKVDESACFNEHLPASKGVRIILNPNLLR